MTEAQTKIFNEVSETLRMVIVTHPEISLLLENRVKLYEMALEREKFMQVHPKGSLEKSYKIPRVVYEWTELHTSN
ncbi:hypothetical protein [Flavobacterium yafengii]|uniref:hypothetical protein n=1 Tax=Flavobacterium yafengii TaxID=3041253 RepID=UPI0024A95CBD|nr:hypothetical protein [Flavobacterium yafengii]MDI6047532.1 hypothetical protein [Flavobacterium yafengii]